MVEIHGWITLRETSELTDDEDTERILGEIQKEINRTEFSSLQVKVNNGAHFMEFSRYSNHMSEGVKKLISFFKTVGRTAEGSYGLLYVHDDENSEHYNEFVVYRLARGRVTVFQDPFLSPVFPTVEDGDVLS